MKEFLLPKYQACYYGAIKQFYANLTIIDEPEGHHYLKTMVHSEELSIYLETIYQLLGWSEEEIRSSKNYVKITKQDSLEDIRQIQQLPDLTQVDIIKSFVKEGGTYSKKNMMYASRLQPLPHLLNLILTYNLYPIKNHTELTYVTTQILYCIVDKIPVQWAIFILSQLIPFQGDPPYGSLICKFLDRALPQKLSELGYTPCRMGYTITTSSIHKMGLLVNPTQKPGVGSSCHTPQTPHTSSSSTPSLTPGEYQ